MSGWERWEGWEEWEEWKGWRKNACGYLLHAGLADQFPGRHHKIFEVAAQPLLQLNQAQARLVGLLRLVDLPDDLLDLRRRHHSRGLDARNRLRRAKKHPVPL